MKELYSNGANAVVLIPEIEDAVRFPNADLMRVDQSADKHWFARLYYRHKIAKLLFPKHFIEVVGAQISLEDPNDKEYDHPAYPFALFSKDGQVDPEHAVFSSHMRTSITEGKVSSCKCIPCVDHRKFHLENGLAIRAVEVYDETSKTGIIPAYQDPSDYCLSSDESIIFFELDGFDKLAVGKYLQSIENPTNAQIQAMEYLGRFNALYQQSRRDSLRSGGGVLALN